MPSPGQMNFAAIIGGLTRGLSEGLSFKRKYEMDIARQQGMAKYRQEQLGMQKKRLEFEARRTEIAEEDAEYKMSIRKTPEELKKDRKLERKREEKEISRIGVSPKPDPTTTRHSNLQILNKMTNDLLEESKGVDLNISQFQAKLGQLETLNKGKPATPEMTSLTDQINKENARKGLLRTQIDANRGRMEKLLKNEEFIQKKATITQKDAIVALKNSGLKLAGEPIDDYQATNYVKAIYEANPEQLNKLFKYFRDNNVIGPNVSRDGFQAAELLKRLFQNRSRELNMRR